MTEPIDTITSRDLPNLRTAMLAYAADEVFGDDFRATCHAVVTAIDQARDDDESTHTELQASLEAFVSAGNEELQRSARIVELCHRISDAEETVEFRDALIELIPLLPRRHVLLVAEVIADALLATGVEPALALDLAAMPAASDHLQ
jgi:hypothetical protein